MPLDVPGCTRATMIVAESICFIYRYILDLYIYILVLYIIDLSRKYDRQSIPNNNRYIIAQAIGYSSIIYLYILDFTRAPIEFVVGTDHCAIVGLGLN